MFKLPPIQETIDQVREGTPQGSGLLSRATGIGVPAGYVLQILREPLGAGPATAETVCVLGDDPDAAVTLVKTALQLGDETVQIVRTLSGEEARQMGVKPFQVKHLP